MTPANNNTSSSQGDLIELVKHYGNMRFAMFTVFSAILGGLISFPFSEGGRLFFTSYPQLRPPLGISGLVLSLLFTFAELRIAYLLYIYQSQLYEHSALPKPRAPLFWAFFAAATMAAPLVIAALFWLSYWLSDLSIPGCS